MNKRHKTKSIFWLSFVLLIVFPIVTSPILIQAKNEVNESFPGVELVGEYTDTVRLEVTGESIFQIDAIGPGDKWTSSIRFKNQTPKEKMFIKLLKIENNILDDKLFTCLDVDIYLKDQVIFSGKYSEISSALSTMQFLDEDKLELYFEMPITCNNAYQNAVLDTTWYFEIYYDKAPQKPTDTGDTTTPLVYIAMACLSLSFLIFLYAYKNSQKDATHRN